MKDLKHYEVLAEILYYPGEDIRERTEAAAEALREGYPEAYAELEDFRAFVQDTDPLEVQELYTRSFDVQSVTTMDVGYVLFGDDYKRGALLVNLARELREAGVDCRNELGDHLPNVLILLARLQDEALKKEFVGRILLPALAKMIGEFEPQRIESKNKVYMKHMKTILEIPGHDPRVYRKALMAVEKVLKHDFEIIKTVLPEQSADFLRSIGSEIKLEA